MGLRDTFLRILSQDTAARAHPPPCPLPEVLTVPTCADCAFCDPVSHSDIACRAFGFRRDIIGGESLAVGIIYPTADFARASSELCGISAQRFRRRGAHAGRTAHLSRQARRARARARIEEADAILTDRLREHAERLP